MAWVAARPSPRRPSVHCTCIPPVSLPSRRSGTENEPSKFGICHDCQCSQTRASLKLARPRIPNSIWIGQPPTLLFAGSSNIPRTHQSAILVSSDAADRGSWAMNLSADWGARAAGLSIHASCIFQIFGRIKRRLVFSGRKEGRIHGLSFTTTKAK